MAPLRRDALHLLPVQSPAAQLPPANRGVSSGDGSADTSPWLNSSTATAACERLHGLPGAAASHDCDDCGDGFGNGLGDVAGAGDCRRCPLRGGVRNITVVFRGLAACVYTVANITWLISRWLWSCDPKLKAQR